jgi:hypothetical protein
VLIFRFGGAAAVRGLQCFIFFIFFIFLRALGRKNINTLPSFSVSRSGGNDDGLRCCDRAWRPLLLFYLASGFAAVSGAWHCPLLRVSLELSAAALELKRWYFLIFLVPNVLLVRDV